MSDDFRPNAIGYLRVSTEDQAESGLGLEAQRASITAAAARLGLTLRDVFVDAGVSGARPMTARPVLLQATMALQRGDVFLIAKRDRLGRDPFELTLIERQIAKRGARVVSAAGEGTDNNDPASVLIRGVVDQVAQYERLLIAARTKAALAVKRAKGERIGTLPFGSQIDEDGARAHRRGCQTRSLPVDTCACGGRPVQLEGSPVEQRLLARLRELRTEGRSTREIAADLTHEGWRTRRGTPWRFQYVARRLRKAAS